MRSWVAGLIWTVSAPVHGPGYCFNRGRASISGCMGVELSGSSAGVSRVCSRSLSKLGASLGRLLEPAGSTSTTFLNSTRQRRTCHAGGQGSARRFVLASACCGFRKTSISTRASDPIATTRASKPCSAPRATMTRAPTASGCTDSMF
jgi:hypothetical protein